MLRSYRTDYLLWAVLAGGIFVALGFADVFPVGSMWARARALAAGNYGCATGDMVIEVGFQAILLAVPAAVVGWVGHAAAVLCGLRLSGRAAGHAGEPEEPPGSGVAGDYAEWAGGSVGAGPGQLIDGWGPADGPSGSRFVVGEVHAPLKDPHWDREQSRDPVNLATGSGPSPSSL